MDVVNTTRELPTRLKLQSTMKQVATNTRAKLGERHSLHCYIDSGVRHYLKYLREDNDEPHNRAFVWNMLGAIWTIENKPEFIDIPAAKEVTECHIEKAGQSNRQTLQTVVYP